MGWQSIYFILGGSRSSEGAPIQLDFRFHMRSTSPGYLLVLFTVQDSQFFIFAGCDRGVCPTENTSGVWGGGSVICMEKVKKMRVWYVWLAYMVAESELWLWEYSSKSQVNWNRFYFNSNMTKHIFIASH